jgi:hypothetical protein
MSKRRSAVPQVINDQWCRLPKLVVRVAARAARDPAVRVHVHAIADVRAGQMVHGMSRSGQKPPRHTHSEHAAPMPSRIALITCTGVLLVGGATGCGSSTPESAPTDWPSASAASPSQTTVTVPTSDENFVRAAQAAGAQ